MHLVSRLASGIAGDTPVASGQSRLEVDIVESVREVCRDEWNHVVEHASRGSVFHRYEWLDAVEAGLDRTPRHLVVRKDDNLVGLFPNFVAPLDGADRAPFRRLTSVDPGFGGPVMTTDTDAVLAELLDAVPDMLSPRTIVHEIRALDPSYVRYNTALQAHDYVPNRRRCRFLVHLTRGYDDVLAGMSRSRRRGIERGRETDRLEIVEEPVTWDTLERYYRTYEQVMARIGTDPFPFRFFEELLDMDDRLLLVTARVDGKYAGGLLEIVDEEQSSVHGYLSAVPERYFEHHTSERLYDYVIRWGIANGYDTYDLGTTKPDYENGVFRYKEGFGGQAIPTLVWERGVSPVWDVFAAGRSLYLKHVG
ncbi:GNAT family N-acetyltransferase [Halomicroarcula sp. S1AR25-4]|uniref:GNAT family N-acetyltransferase n=1 Tax=Haloarcula sp. S1AR25-4 TaxID=2950538 RepID=UPI002876F20A|nr:GNAT family N-acetyltransferase [Halomicroarcula sp. S1AR25-4]MDS0276414.1 GNAT family N-acetyltransferase [Halomicroarcula sp. S1AR25-4]